MAPGLFMAAGAMTAMPCVGSRFVRSLPAARGFLLFATDGVEIVLGTCYRL